MQESLERALEEQAGAARYIDVATEITVVDDRTLRFELPEPVGAFMNNLAASHFIIFKDGPDGAVMTGPYQPTRLVTDSELELEAFEGHWDGPPPVARIHVLQMSDANARSLALQSGEVDLITQVPAAIAGSLTGDVEVVTSPSIRVHYLVPNLLKEPFNDPAVREAFNLAIDRSILNQIVLDGNGAELWHMFPPDIGIPTPEPLETDVERAAEILDDAGWVTGPGETRTKDGVDLAFTIYSYPGRPELTPMAVSIQDQLGRLGFDIEVEQVDDVTAMIEGGDFQASMWSLNMLPNGDPYFALSSTIIEGASFNYGGYQNAELEEIVEQIRLTSDPDEREQLVLEAQELLGEDVVNIYLISPPQIAAYRTDVVQELVLHPNDMYPLDIQLAAQ